MSMSQQLEGEEGGGMFHELPLCRDSTRCLQHERIVCFFKRMCAAPNYF